jgi:hypothetical protein
MKGHGHEGARQSDVLDTDAQHFFDKALLGLDGRERQEITAMVIWGVILRGLQLKQN